MFVRIPDYDNEPEPENGNGDNDRPSVYWLIFVMSFCGMMAWDVRYINFNWVWSPGNIRYFLEDLFTAASGTITLMLIWDYLRPALLAAWPSKPVATSERAQTSQSPQPIPPPQNNMSNGRNEEARQVEQVATQPGQTRLVINNKLVNLVDYGVDHDHWQRVKQARSGGGLPDVSLPKLHALGIDRKHRASEGDSDAHRIIDMLLDLGMVKDGGNNRPYIWTDIGENALPYPNGARVH